MKKRYLTSKLNSLGVIRTCLITSVFESETSQYLLKKDTNQISSKFRGYFYLRTNSVSILLVFSLKKWHFHCSLKVYCSPELIDWDHRNDSIENRWKVYLNVEKVSKMTNCSFCNHTKQYWLLSIKYKYLSVSSCLLSAVAAFSWRRAAASWRASTAWFSFDSTDKRQLNMSYDLLK